MITAVQPIRMLFVLYLYSVQKLCKEASTSDSYLQRASEEINFLCLNRIKTSSNSTIQERLSALACISIKKVILNKQRSHSTWHDGLIDKFTKKKDRRVILLYKY